jgi:hypothetical protein
MKDPRLRIAELIRSKLLIARRNSQTAMIERLSAVSNDMNQYQKLCHLMTQADRRRLDGAVARLKHRISHLLSNARFNFDAAHQTINQPRQPLPTLHDLVSELDQLEREFGEWTFDATDNTLSVATEDITLEDVPLGPFEIRLYLVDLSTLDRRQPFDCQALDPNPAASADHVTHPHVSDHGLCAGDATVALRSALETGRLCDFFVMVRQVLRTYNPGSPYVSLDNWYGQSCHDCGYTVSGESSYYCEACGYDYCDECSTYCRGCDETRCLSCVTTCEFCDEVFCRRCISRCPECGESCCYGCLENDLCPNCHEQPPEAPENTDQPSETNPQGAPHEPTQPQTIPTPSPEEQRQDVPATSPPQAA